MKKLFIILLVLLFPFALIAQEKEISNCEEELQQIDEEIVFFIVEEMPKFQGEGVLEFRKWIGENIKYPKIAIENNITGKVFVSFVVNAKGKVKNVQVIRGIDPILDAEAVRVVKTSPNWTAGKQRGVAVSVSYTVPINFISN